MVLMMTVCVSGTRSEGLMNQADSRKSSRRLTCIVVAALIPACIFFNLVPGCAPTPGQSDPDVNDTSTQGAPPDADPVWEAWPKPRLALMLTGEQHGYFEPCGCTANQLGGMSRRADLLSVLKSADWQVRGLDVGGLSRRTARQAALKMNTTLKALHQLDYLGVGVGTEELRLGVENLLEVHMNMENVQASVPFVSANLLFLDGALDGFPVASRVVEAGALKIGVTSVLSEKLKREILPLPDVTWSDPCPALKTVLDDFKTQQVDVRVLLSQASRDESIAFAEQFPEFDFILTARGVGDPDPNSPPTQVGDTLVIESGRKGKYVGILALYPNEEPKFRYQLVSLERDTFKDNQAMIDLMSEYQRELKDLQIVLTDGISAPHPSGATFVGTDTCGECHTEALEIWKKTPHAHALESLDPTNKRVGHERLNGVNRTFDPECIACHVVGWDPQEYIRFQSGYLNEEFAADESEKMLHKLLAGVQCEKLPWSRKPSYRTA